MWKPDGAVLAYVDNRSSPVQPTTNGLVLHVQAGNGLLTGWFDNPESRASSTWQALKKADAKGSLYQFGDPDHDRMWAQADGNYAWASVETEGYPTEPLNDLQLDDVARIYAAGHLNEGWPFQLAEKPTDRGLGWHGMGGTAWGGHFGCPGDIRKAQRGEILRRAQALTTGGFLMALSDADQQKLLDAANRVLAVGTASPRLLNDADGAQLRKDIGYVRDQIRGDLSTMTAEQAAQAIPDTIAQQVVDLLAARLNPKGA